MVRAVRYRWVYALVIGLIALMAVGLGSPFAKGGMPEADKELALAGLLASGLALGLAGGLRRRVERVLLPLLGVPVALLLALVLVNRLLACSMADPEREIIHDELYCGLLYALTLGGFQVLLLVYKRLGYES